VYRDDTCAVCGESLPPDHFYCREHAADVDDRVHRVAEVLPALRGDVDHARTLLAGIAEETWDYVAENDPSDPEWPPPAEVTLRLDAAQIDVDVDSEPGYVRVALRLSLTDLLEATRGGLEAADESFLAACRDVEGANATH
jgi:hypothetical protein